MKGILSAREARSQHIDEVMAAFPNKTVVVLKLNMVGQDKNPVAFQWMLTVFHQKIMKQYESKIQSFSQHLSTDGNYYLYVIDDVPEAVKTFAIHCEHSVSIGRLIDIDVYHEKPLTRHSPRKCLICGDVAHACIRNKSHSVSEVKRKMTEIMSTYLTELMTKKTIEYMKEEVTLYPCFGLVSLTDQGCHDDMDGDMFMKSIEALRPYIRMYLESDVSAQALVKIGQDAETAMFQATDGVNTHKGLIFLLGIFLPVLKQSILRKSTYAQFQDDMISLAQDIIGDYYQSLKTAKTPGDNSYLNYGIKGARGIALTGFGSILNQPNHTTDYDRLLYFMSHMNDTTIVHKTSYETLQQVKKDASDLLADGGYLKNKDKYKKMSDNYITLNISPGGSADMWVISKLFDTFKGYLKQ